VGRFQRFNVAKFTNWYRIAGKFGKFDESQAICQTKTIQISTYNYNLLAESIHSPNLLRTEFTKLYTHQTFLLYSSYHIKSLQHVTLACQLLQ